MSVERESFKAGMQCRALGSNKAGKKKRPKLQKGKGKYAIELAATIILLLADRWSVYPAAHTTRCLLSLPSYYYCLLVPLIFQSLLYVFCARAPMSVSCSHGFSPPFSHMRDASGERRPASSHDDRAARIIPFHRSASERLPHLGRSIQRGLPP